MCFQKNVSPHRAAKPTRGGGGGGAAVVSSSDGWLHFNEEELQRTLAERNATWQMMHLSCSTPHHHNYNNTTPITSTTTTTNMDPKLINLPNLNIFIAPPKRDDNLNHFFGLDDDDDDNDDFRDDYGNSGNEKSQTLQLFPLRSEETAGEDEKDREISMASMKNDHYSTPSHFIEFLPLKN